MQRDASIHTDLLSQVASSEYESSEVRRILGAEQPRTFREEVEARDREDAAYRLIGPLTDAELTAHNRRRKSDVERAIRRRYAANADRADGWPGGMAAVLFAVFVLCLSVPLIVHLVPRVVAWLVTLP